MRGSVGLVLGALGVLAIARASGADETRDDGEPDRHGPPRWQAASGAPALTRIWGTGSSLYGVGAAGAYRSTDGGASWAPADGAGPANGVWGTDESDVWIVRARSLHHTYDGANWTAQPLPMLAFGAAMEGMWGIDRDRYVFGVDRVDGKPRGVILRSRDGGTSFRAESLPEVERIAGVWGRAANDVYAVGAKGIVLHSTGDGAWTTVRAATGSALESIWGTSTGMFAVGANGTVLYSSDGKVWSPRQSGVRYTLTSISRSAQEFYAGSTEGPPLRSTDGVTWKPVTALIDRGNVWSDGARPVLASSEVKYLGETVPLLRATAPIDDRKKTSVASSAPVSKEVDQARTLSNRFVSHYAHDLLMLARRRLGDPTSAVPSGATGRVMQVLGPVNGCSRGLDRGAPQRSSSGVELRFDVTCSRTCRDVKGVARVTISEGGKSIGMQSLSVSVPVGSCGEQDKAVQTVLDTLEEEALKTYRRGLDQTLADELRRAFTAPDKVEALSKYVLTGGNAPQAQTDLSALLQRPVTWEGFVWNEPLLARCEPKAVSAVETRADEYLREGSFAVALDRYDQLLRCKPEVRRKAYLAACRAKDFGTAKGHFDALGQPAGLVQICMKEGWDPRSNNPPPQPSTRP